MAEPAFSHPRAPRDQYDWLFYNIYLIISIEDNLLMKKIGISPSTFQLISNLQNAFVFAFMLLRLFFYLRMLFKGITLLT